MNLYAEEAGAMRSLMPLGGLDIARLQELYNGESKRVEIGAYCLCIVEARPVVASKAHKHSLVVCNVQYTDKAAQSMSTHTYTHFLSVALKYIALFGPVDVGVLNNNSLQLHPTGAEGVLQVVRDGAIKCKKLIAVHGCPLNLPCERECVWMCVDVCGHVCMYVDVCMCVRALM